MNAETNIILRYRREHDSWVCAECDTENFSFHKQCVVCGHMKSPSDQILKAWTPEDERIAYKPVDRTPARRVAPAAATTPGTISAPVHTAGGKVFRDEGGYTPPPEKGNGLAIFLGILIATVIIVALFVLVQVTSAAEHPGGAEIPTEIYLPDEVCESAGQIITE